MFNNLFDDNTKIISFRHSILMGLHPREVSYEVVTAKEDKIETFFVFYDGEEFMKKKIPLPQWYLDNLEEL